ncbi:MAG: FecCD family ABC transporter permease [Fusobacteriaceae bacterium]
MLLKKPVKNYKTLCFILIIFTMLFSVLIVTIGTVSLDSKDVYKIIINKIFNKEIFIKNWKQSSELIVWNLRTPRLITGFISGSSLAFVGILMQCLTKNSLASPYILGISSGASTGAVFALLFLGSSAFFSVPLLSFIFGILTAFIVFYFSGAGSFSHSKLILIGVAISSFFSGITTLMIMMAPNDREVRSALFWMSGSLAGSSWKYIPLLFFSLVISIIFIFPKYRELNILITGDENAIALGVNVKKMRILIVIISTFLTGVIVSNTGIIGFVGLVIPHVVRGLVGGNHKKIIPVSILLGGFFLILADTLTRVILSSQEIPIGVITSLLGAPFFLNMLRKKSYRFGGN